MANIDDTIGLPNSHPAIEYRQTRTNPSARLARQVEGGGSAGRWIRLPAVVAQNCSGSIDSQKRQVFDLRNALRAGRALSTSIRRDRVRRSSAGRIVRTDPKSIPNTRVGEGRQAGLGAATMFRASPGGATLGGPGFWVKFGLAGADGMPAFCGASIATDPRTKRDQRWGSSRNRHERLPTSLGKCGGPRPPSARAPRGARLRGTCLAWPRNSTSSTCLRRQRLGGTDDARAADSMTDWVDFSRAHGGARRQDRRRHALGVAGEIG